MKKFGMERLLDHLFTMFTSIAVVNFGLGVVVVQGRWNAVAVLAGASAVISWIGARKFFQLARRLQNFHAEIQQQEPGSDLEERVFQEVYGSS